MCGRRVDPMIRPMIALAVAARLAAAQTPIAITHVSVIDGSGSAARRDLTVVIRGTRIVAVGPARTTRIPVRALVVNGRGKFLIPGFWDMHVHVAADDVERRTLLGLFVANGVTGIRDMGGNWDTLRTWRRDIAAGRLVGPRIIAAGPYIEGGDIPLPHLLARTPD